ncbi:four-carbon acid sugar kinase family protein [Marinivivus vitaminiproducens]|uniref:four-carbon acid sugar kinase family protein n=1 Tax=Marinivivus vitaminiproducens TaxID=3035935 RepID=UPI00279AC0C6|nr:four-carbon acid sugar kinase family protein [Geminicoccaceae bacterium SCSIO 64248]
MTLRVAIIADDLTGALDAAAPFAGRGMATVAATGADGLDAALARRPDVLTVSTASREAAPEEAGRRCAAVAERVARAGPAILFKKIDSRLKGHLEAEIGAVMTAFGQDRLLVAPGIPDLGRIVADGAVQGFGAAVPIPVAERLGDLARRAAVPDTPDVAAMRALAAKVVLMDRRPLLVGARGLADALAVELTGRARTDAAFAPAFPALVAVGSTDPITRAQLDRLTDAAPDCALVAAPNGRAGSDVPDGQGRLTVMATAPGALAEEPAVVAARFAALLAAHVHRHRPRLIVCSGGETAAALAVRLGLAWLDVQGEAMPGLPLCAAEIDGKAATLVTKSGGFGDPDTLCRLLGLVRF